MCPRSPRSVPLAQWLAVVLAVVLSLGCQGTPGEEAETAIDSPDGDGPVAPSHDPIVFPNPTKKANDVSSEDRPLDDEEAGWREKLELAQRYAKAGFDDEAITIIEAALDQEPREPWGSRLRGLKTTLRMRKTAQELIRAEVRSERDYVTFGQHIDITIRLTNVSPEMLVIRAPQTPGTGESAVSPTAVTLELNRKDRDITASEVKRTWTQTLYLQETDGGVIRIPAGGRYEHRARIPASDVGDALSGFRSLEISGTVRTSRMMVGDTERPVRVPLRRARISIVPRGYEPLAEDPLGSMQRAAEAVSPVHLLVATEFVPPSRRIEAVQVLARALGEGHASLERACLGALSLIRDRSVGRPVAPLAQPLMDALARWPRRKRAIMAGLSAATGVEIAPDVRLWHDWWRRATSARTSVEAGGE